MGFGQLVLVFCGLTAVLHLRITSACRRCYHTSNLSERELFFHADFAMNVHVWRLISVNPRGETAYQITVTGQPFKVKSVRQYQDRVYTPTNRRCGVTLDPGHDYLITGKYRVAKNGVQELFIDTCGWVDEWSSLELEQIHWLRRQKFMPTPAAIGGGQRSVVDPSVRSQPSLDPFIQTQGPARPSIQNHIPTGHYVQSQGPPVGRGGRGQRPIDTVGHNPSPIGAVAQMHGPVDTYGQGRTSSNTFERRQVPAASFTQPTSHVGMVRQDQYSMVPATHQRTIDPYGQTDPGHYRQMPPHSYAF